MVQCRSQSSLRSLSSSCVSVSLIGTLLGFLPLELFVLGEAFPLHFKYLDGWLCALTAHTLLRLENDGGRETFICACAGTMKSMPGCLFVGASLWRSNPKSHPSDVRAPSSSSAPRWRKLRGQSQGEMSHRAWPRRRGGGQTLEHVVRIPTVARVGRSTVGETAARFRNRRAQKACGSATRAQTPQICRSRKGRLPGSKIIAETLKKHPKNTAHGNVLHSGNCCRTTRAATGAFNWE